MGWPMMSKGLPPTLSWSAMMILDGSIGGERGQRKGRSSRRRRQLCALRGAKKRGGASNGREGALTHLRLLIVWQRYSVSLTTVNFSSFPSSTSGLSCELSMAVT